MTSHYTKAETQLKKAEKGLTEALTEEDGEKASDQMILAATGLLTALVHSILAIAEAVSESK